MLASLSRTVYRTLSRPYLGARGAFLSTQSAHSDARDGTTQAVRMLSGTAATVLVTGGLLAHYTTEPVRTEKAVPEHSKTALSPEEWRSFKLIEKTQRSPNTYTFRFELPTEDSVPGLKVASCLVTRAPIGSLKDDGTRKFCIRPYTPVTGDETPGHMDLLIKVYPEGNMSKHIGEMKIGDRLEMKVRTSNVG